MAYQKCFIGPLVWKCFTNDFERKLKFENFALFLHYNVLALSAFLTRFGNFSIRFQGFPTFCTFFMYINVHGHQIFAKCTLNECTKMELDPPIMRRVLVGVRGVYGKANNAWTAPLFDLHDLYVHV